MGYGINGTIQFGIDPYGYNDNSLNRNRNFAYSYSAAWSVNEPINFSIYWNLLKENEEAQASNYDVAAQTGDVVNVLFDVYQISDSSAAIFPEDWTLVGTIRKSRDIRNISQMDRLYGGDGTQVPQGHIFSVDISEMVRDLLSYSLVPHGKGTWTSTFFGGLNGGKMPQANLLVPVYNDKFLLTKNGSLRKCRVNARTEIIDNNGIIREATEVGSYLYSNSEIFLLNNSKDYDTSQMQVPASTFIHSGWGTSTRYLRSFMNNYDNGSWANDQDAFHIGKDMRMDEQQEVIQWIQGTINNYSLYHNPTATGETETDPLNTGDLVAEAYVTVAAYDKDRTFVRSAKLYDWTQNLKPKTTINGVTGVYDRGQYRNCVQNISPVFINANCIHNDSTVKDIWENGGETYTRRLIDVDGNTSDKTALFLNDEIEYYMIRAAGTTTTQGNGTGIEKVYSEKRWYKIDRERWLNTGNSNYGDYYAGIYYTELRGDQMTLPNPVRCKGFRWNFIEPPFFRVHFLNKTGGISSYTLKGHASESINAEKDIIQRKNPDRFDVRIGRSASANPWPSDNAPTTGNYLSDYVGNSANYQGGLEVLNTTATKSGTVSSRPLNKEKAKWLSQLITSPNVWTENSFQGSAPINALYYQIMNRGVSDLTDGISTDGRTPNNMQYVPIIITNSSVDIYDESKGLVTITFEYTYSHPLLTQSN